MNKPDPRRDRQAMQRELDRRIASGGPLVPYQTHVRRWMHCAPEGAIFLVAPLMGWDGTPFRSRGPQGPWGRYAKRLRQARIERGLHPLGGRYDVNGNPLSPEQSYTSVAGRACMAQGGSC